MSLKQYTYAGEDDYWRIRAFLREIFLLHNCRAISWPVARLDYWRWHVVLNCGAYPAVDDATFIWETPDKGIGAVLVSESEGEAHFQVHPAYRTDALLTDMLNTAERQLAKTTDDGRRLVIWVNEHEADLNQLLESGGYMRSGWVESQRRRDLADPLPVPTVPEGYTLRPLGDVDELPARSWVSWRAFHPDEPDEAYEGWEWYHNIQRMPLYRRDLDIIVVAPAGEHAAFCTLWYDDVTRCGYFEPVGIAPEHQRKGLGKAVMVEAMRRMQRMGGRYAWVGGYSDAANALYASVMSPDCERSVGWVREF